MTATIDETSIQIFDVTQPIWGVMHQSASGKRTTTAFFQGETAEHDALAQAEALATSTKTPAVIFGPQKAVKGAPNIKATDVVLAF